MTIHITTDEGVMKTGKHMKLKKYRKYFSELHKGKRYSPSTEYKLGHRGLSGRENPMWTGDKVTYRGIHQWLYKIRGKPKKCVLCKTTNAEYYDWALKKGKKYKRRISHFIRLCRACHVKYDQISEKGVKTKRLKYKNWIPTKWICTICQNMFLDSHSSKRKYCSVDCYHKALRTQKSRRIIN